MAYLCGMNAIEQWISDPGRDYAAGVDLLEQVCKNSRLVHVFRHRSPRFAMDDLEAELRRRKTSMPEGTEKEMVRPVEEKKKTTVPTVVEKAKKMVHDSWVILSKLHRQMYDTGEGNSEKELAARRKLMEERDHWIERYNSVYEAKELYFAGKLTEAQLQEVVDGKTIEQVLHPDPPKEETALSELSDLQIAKKAKAAKAAINRCKNQLLYQQDTAAKKENPLPDCPKRTAIEQRLAEKKAELATLEAELKRRGC